MNAKAFRFCDGDHGPWEASPCPVARYDDRHRFTNADAAVYFLERASGPLTAYDIQRAFKREFGWAPGTASLIASLSVDRRCCWGGRALYGLYRHGLIPGPRKLADVAQIILFCHDEPLGLEILDFAMRYMGYRFNPLSLYNALCREQSIEPCGWRCWTVDRSPDRAQVLRTELPIAPTAAGFETVLNRTRDVLFNALLERERRIDRVRTQTAVGCEQT